MKQTVDNKTLWIALALVIIAVLVMGAILGAYFSGGKSVDTVKVERLFLDVDGDKKIDLLIEGEVIFNDGPLTQPTPKP
jgi:hypothetical protein